MVEQQVEAEDTLDRQSLLFLCHPDIPSDVRATPTQTAQSVIAALWSATIPNNCLKPIVNSLVQAFFSA